MFIRILLIFVFSLYSAGIFAQSDNTTGMEMKSLSARLQKLRWDMNLGTSFSFIPNYGGGMNYFAAPGFSYPLKNNISLSGGVLTGFSSRSFPVFGEQNENANKYGYTSIYGSVSYQMNENVFFYGTGIKNIANYGVASPLFFNSFDEISFGSSIRLGRSVTIGASVHFRDYSYPLNNFPSPFFNY